MSYIPDLHYYQEVAKGKVPKHSLVHKFGRNANVGIATDPADVWAYGPTQSLITFPSSGSVVDVSSGNANDTSAGSGAQKIIIEGIEHSTWAYITEEVPMNGLSVVTSSKQFVRVFRAYVSQPGTYHGNNAGQIIVQLTGGGAVLCTIPQSVGQSQQAAYTVPVGYTAYLLYQLITVDATTGDARMLFFQMPNANDASAPFSGARRVMHDYDGVTGRFERTFYQAPQYVGPGTDLWFRLQLASANNMKVSAEFDLLLIED